MFKLFISAIFILVLIRGFFRFLKFQKWYLAFLISINKENKSYSDLSPIEKDAVTKEAFASALRTLIEFLIGAFIIIISGGLYYGWLFG
jgi:hypothetical protein